MRKRKRRTNNYDEEEPTSISQYLPIEIWTRILLYLPSKSLLRFRCVCKTWRSLIDTPDFISEHIMTFRNNVYETHIVDVVDRTVLIRDGRRRLRKIAEFPYPVKDRRFRFQVYYHGIALMDRPSVTRIRRTVLWNPSIGKYIYIPACRATTNSRDGVDDDVAFGMGSVGNDYKVVAIFYQDRTGLGAASRPFAVVEVYSLNYDRWKRVPNVDLYLRIWGLQVFVSGAIHWIGNKGWDVGKCNEDRVVSFDLKTEVFSYFALPQCSYDRSDVRYANLVAFHESLALLDYLPGMCHLWVMDDHGVPNTWIRKFSVDNVMREFMHFKRSGELLFCDPTGEIKLYDIVNEEMRNVARSSCGFEISMGPYVESLVLSTIKRKLFTRRL